MNYRGFEVVFSRCIITFLVEFVWALNQGVLNYKGDAILAREKLKLHPANQKGILRTSQIALAHFCLFFVLLSKLFVRKTLLFIRLIQFL